MQEEDSRRSTDLSFNGDVTFKIADETTLRFDAYYLSTRRDEAQDTFIYEGDGSVGGLDFDDGEHEAQDSEESACLVPLCVVLTTLVPC